MDQIRRESDDLYLLVEFDNRKSYVLSDDAENLCYTLIKVEHRKLPVRVTLFVIVE
jgi:hypothetical protein